MNSLSIANRYYDALRKKLSFDEVPMQDDLVFKSPNGPVEGAAVFRQMLTGLAENIVGIDVRHQFEKTDTVVSVYDFDMGLPGGPIPMAEVLRLREGAIAEVELLFDSKRLGS